MSTTLAVVQACCGTAQSRRKIARRLGGKSVLEWVVRRATDCLRLDGVIVVTSAVRENEFVADLVPPDVPVFVSPKPDALSRFVAALEKYPASEAVRIRADNPFIDPVLIDQLVTTAAANPACDYVSYCLRDGRPAILAPIGIFAEWFRVRALRRADREAIDPVDRQRVTPYLYSHPEKFRVRLIPAPFPLAGDDGRAIADIEEFWEYAQSTVEMLGPEALDWQRMAVLLGRHLASQEEATAAERGASGD